MDFAAKFWSRVKIATPDQCWEWQFFRDKDGYGRCRFEGVVRKVHRIAFFLTHGYWPEVVRHSCDNPPCCNPGHLLAGDHVSNVADRVARGRTKGGKLFGKDNPNYRHGRRCAEYC